MIDTAHAGYGHIMPSGNWSPQPISLEHYMPITSSRLGCILYIFYNNRINILQMLCGKKKPYMQVQWFSVCSKIVNLKDTSAVVYYSNIKIRYSLPPLISPPLLYLSKRWAGCKLLPPLQCCCSKNLIATYLD